MTERKNAVDWTKYLLPGERIQDVPAATLRKRRHDSLGGISTSKSEKVRLNRLEAELKEKAIIGLSMDEPLFAEMKQLEDHAKATYEGIPRSCGFGSAGVQWGSRFIPTTDLEYVFHLIQSGGELLRACNYHKLSSDTLDDNRSSILDQDQELPYQDQKYYPYYADSMLNDIIKVGHDVRLTKELSDFLVKLIQAYQSWAACIADEDVKYRQQIDRELARRLAGEETFVKRLPITVEPPKPVVLQLPNPVPLKTYLTGSDIEVNPQPPSLAQLAIENFKERGGHVDWSRLADEETT